MNENQIEKRCKCGHCFVQKWKPFRWVIRSGYLTAQQYCPVCGWHLGDDGVARRTVVVPEEPITGYIATDQYGEEYVSLDECLPGGYLDNLLHVKKVIMIPIPQEDEGE